MWLHSKINLAQGHQSGQLHGLADAEWTQRSKVLPRDNQNRKGASEKNKNKNVQSTKAKAALLETCNTSHLHGKKVHDIYTQMYMVRKTMFSNQTS
jgi:hypothetical protein